MSAKWIIMVLLALLGAPAGAQMSGCARDASGALQCTQRPSAAGGAGTYVRPIQRPDLAADAARRSSAMIEARRQALEQQRTEREEAASRRRSQCLDRAAGDAQKLAGCSQ